MNSKKLRTKVLAFSTINGQVTEPTITTSGHATCVKCHRKFTEDEWESIEKDVGWQPHPSRPEIEGFKIKCMHCNQLNIWTHRKKIK